MCEKIKHFLLKRALFEYQGSFIGHLPHGKAKQPKGFYQRSHPDTKQKIKDMKSSGVKPTETYKILLKQEKDEIKEETDIRDLQQIYNVRKEVNRQDNGAGSTQNFADHIMHLSSLIAEGDNFIQSLIHESCKVPSVLLYTQDTLDLVKECCCKGINKEVLGVDRTFNLGDIYVTVTSFKHNGLLRNTSNEPPILFGPMLLHGTCTYDVYSHLFAKFASYFSAEEKSNLTIGSDEEHAIRKAVREMLPTSTSVLCYRHVKNNVITTLKDKVGVNDSNRNKIRTTSLARA